MTQRVSVITGASSGIGRAVAHECADAGDHVVLVARGQVSLEETAMECRARGAASVRATVADVGVEGEVAALFDDIGGTYGRVDAVVSCAGVVAYGRTEDVPVEVFDKVLRTNVNGSINVSRHALAHMRRQKRGALLLVGSVIGHIAVPSMTPYVLSKHAVRALARQLQLENRDIPDLAVIYVAPGGVDTPIYEQAATYSGFHGKPPPPVASPERVARLIVRRLAQPRGRSQTTIANDVIRLGFNLTPWAFDFLVGPLFEFGALDRTRPTDDTPGNVLASPPHGYPPSNERGNALVGIGKNLFYRLRTLARS